MGHSTILYFEKGRPADFVWYYKNVYTKDQVESSLNWMWKKGFVPDGWGKVIEQARKKMNKTVK